MIVIGIKDFSQFPLLQQTTTESNCTLCATWKLEDKKVCKLRPFSVVDFFHF